MAGLISSLLGGLSGPQVLASKLIGAGLIVTIAVAGLKIYGDAKSTAGKESQYGFIEEANKKYAAAESERLRMKPLLEACTLKREEQAGEIKALHKQNTDAANQATAVLLETQKVNAKAIAAASRNQSSGAEFYAALDKKLEGLKNECDPNGNAIVRGGADVLRTVQQGQQP